MELAGAILYAEIGFALAALLIVGIKTFGSKTAKQTLSRLSHQLHLHG